MVAQNPLTEAHIEALGPGVRLIARTGSGLDAIDLEAARRRGLTVYDTPDYCTAEVATQAVALILAVQRQIIEGDRVARADFDDWRSIGVIAPLDELLAGVIGGGGRIGGAAIARLRPFVREVALYDPYLTEAPEGVELVADLDMLLRRTDVLTVHLPLTAESRGMIGARELALLRPGRDRRQRVARRDRGPGRARRRAAERTPGRGRTRRDGPGAATGGRLRSSTPRT